MLYTHRTCAHSPDMRIDNAILTRPNKRGCSAGMTFVICLGVIALVRSTGSVISTKQQWDAKIEGRCRGGVDDDGRHPNKKRLDRDRVSRQQALIPKLIARLLDVTSYKKIFFNLLIYQSSVSYCHYLITFRYNYITERSH